MLRKHKLTFKKVKIMKKNKGIEMLNKLITINNDRMEGYEVISELTKESSLKILFLHLANTSKKCKLELIQIMNALGESAIVQKTKESGEFFRIWIKVKAALNSREHRRILNSCYFGENKAKKIYEKAIENELYYLNAELKHILINQEQLLTNDRDLIKLLSKNIELK